MLNKKKFIPLLLLPVMMLTGCDDYMAKPNDYETPLVDKVDGSALSSEVYNNIRSVIYDKKWDDGSASTKALDEVLSQIAISVLGRYLKTTEADPVSLTEASLLAEAALKTTPFVKNDKVDAFIKLHPIYWMKDGTTGIRLTDEESVIKEYKKVINQMKRFDKRIAKAMYSKISGGSYNKDGRFYEEKFLMSLVNSNNKVQDPTIIGVPFDLTEAYLITPDIKDEEVFTKKILHLENYQNAAKGFTYIEDEIVPTLYKDELTQQYVYTQAYSTLGRSYARKVNIISVGTDEEYPLLARNIMTAYAGKYINYDKGHEPTFYGTGYNSLDVFNTALRGLTQADDLDNDPLWKDAADLLTLANANKNSKTFNGTIFGGLDGLSIDYFEGTSLGKLVEKLAKIDDNNVKGDTSIESEFTGSGSSVHSVELGFDLKVDQILLENNKKDGWYIKNGGLSDLPDSIRSRLFSIGVSNILDTDEATDRFNKQTGEYAVPEKENYVALIHGKYYLIPAKTEKPVGKEKLNDFVWYDESSKKYFIVEVEEAVSSAKLSVTDDRQAYEWDKKDEVSHEISSILSFEGSTYNTIATQYWLRYASMTFHDDVISRYFKSTYPELF